MRWNYTLLFCSFVLLGMGCENKNNEEAGLAYTINVDPIANAKTFSVNTNNKISENTLRVVENSRPTSTKDTWTILEEQKAKVVLAVNKTSEIKADTLVINNVKKDNIKLANKPKKKDQLTPPRELALIVPDSSAQTILASEIVKDTTAVIEDDGEQTSKGKKRKKKKFLIF